MNAATLFWRLGLMRAIPVEAKLLTWECMTTFDEIPAQTELESLFEKEFPRTCSRLRECGGFYRIWHLVSFNSAEGRRSRFLVALVECPIEVRGRRLLPRQIYLTAVADKSIRLADLSDARGQASASGENDGNYLCYAHADGLLCVLVYFEGRLCHWSEDYVGTPAKLDLALSRFRRFLESDALFSRAKRFEEVPLQGDFSQALFKRAARDSFWRGRDLRKPETPVANGFAELASAMFGRKTFWLVLLALAVLLGKFWDLGEMLKNDLLLNVADVVPPELSVPEISAFENSLQEVSPNAGVESDGSSQEFRAPRERKPQCILPEVFLKGVVGETIAVVTVAGESREISAGDSLGSFEVRSVGRDQIALACGDSSVVKKVGVHEL